MTGGVSIDRVVTGDIELGECPLWSPAEQVLYWVDIDGRRVHRHDPSRGVDESRPVDGRPGSLALTATPGRLLLTTEHRVAWFDWGDGAVTPWLDVEEPGVNRFNDGRVDPAGRMVAGTMWPDTSARRYTGALYRIDPDGTVATLRREVGVPNGLAFDAERGLMYFADTPTRLVLVADYDADTGTRHNVREFLDYRPLVGKPDGGCVDADGCYWSASVHGWALLRVTPDGRVDRTVDVPVELPTMPAFGGAGLDTLYVTSIAADGPDRGGRDGARGGDLLALDVGVQGRPEPVFAADGPAT